MPISTAAMATALTAAVTRTKQLCATNKGCEVNELKKLRKVDPLVEGLHLLLPVRLSDLLRLHRACEVLYSQRENDTWPQISFLVTPPVNERPGPEAANA